MRPIPSALMAPPMLTHFTRASKSQSAIDNLRGILADGVIRSTRRMVRSNDPAVCFFDLRISELEPLLARRNRRRYGPFGIATERRYAFRLGARPVIYLPWREAREAVVQGESWRVVSVDFDRIRPADWTFGRGWRMRGDLPLDPTRCAALVESWRDADEVYEHFDGHPPCAGVIPLKELFRKS